MTSQTSRHVLITGSTTGIGWGLAKAFAQNGDRVTLNGFLPKEIKDPGSLLETLGGSSRHGYSGADVSVPAEIRKMIRDAEAERGPVDVLINNAGIQFVAPVEDFPVEKWDSILAINLSSCFHTTQAVVPKMKERKQGRLINIASVHGLVASPFKSAYVAAKHGLIGFTKSVALELADTGITCNAICPGYVRTPLVEGQIEQQALAHGLDKENVIRDVILAAQPKKEFIEIEHLAAMALFLAGPAATAMTGGAITMDGGWTAR